ncbi:hypothetical protein [Bacillus mojavensis]|uniref:hypothetical protein n=1 Tax=Bacillus mojavensis TaxID=72360 RepID=UPI00227E2191|nr:hypothetical protein [Bacillus mojavensis]MCY9090935.1 hypothetical protein [Bacillus mojavensis]
MSKVGGIVTEEDVREILTMLQRDEPTTIDMTDSAKIIASITNKAGLSTSELKDALTLFMPPEPVRFSGREGGESLRKLFNEIDGGVR